MATIPLKNPYETRVLPAIAHMTPRPPAPPPVTPTRPVARTGALRREAPHRPKTPIPVAQAQATRQSNAPGARRRLAVELQGHDWLEIWDDRVVTSDHTFALDKSFSAHVTPDWRAPLTVDAQLGMALRDERGRWNIYVPQTEDLIWQAIYILRGVCEARGLELPDLEPSEIERDTPLIQERNTPIASMPVSGATARSGSKSTPTTTPGLPAAPARHAYEHAYAMRPADAPHKPAAWIAPIRANTQMPERAATGTTVGMSSESVLIAIVHLSVLFLPVILPGTVWLALRHAEPRVADQAREAAQFQALVACIGTLLLGGATLGSLLHLSGVAAFGLVSFVVVFAAAGVYAFYGVLRATNGHAFRYVKFLHHAD